MAKFYIHNNTTGETFNLNKQIIATEPKGLGNAFNINYKNTSQGSRVQYSVPKFESIQLTLYFNVSGINGYQQYKRLVVFLEGIGTTEFTLEYKDEIGSKYATVMLNNLTKTHIQADGVFSELLTLDRLTYWYIKNEQVLSFNTETNTTYPLKYAVTYPGDKAAVSTVITNSFFKEQPAKIIMRGRTATMPDIKLKNIETGEIISHIRLVGVTQTDQTTIIIDAINKKITIKENDKIKNGYYVTDKRYQSFLVIPPGSYEIIAPLNIEGTASISISYRRYMLG